MKRLFLNPRVTSLNLGGGWRRESTEEEVGVEVGSISRERKQELERERGYERIGREEGKLEDNKGKNCLLRTKDIRGERRRRGRAHISEGEAFLLGMRL